MRLGLQVPNFTWPNGQSELGATIASGSWTTFFRLVSLARQRTKC